MLESGRLPMPAHDARCRECSLKSLCQPEAISAKARHAELSRALYILDET
ncbi:hypothetical protein [Caldichromatium japonicum]|nr:hypothetical protein [Caldichromatium japonicum]